MTSHEPHQFYFKNWNQGKSAASYWIASALNDALTWNADTARVERSST